MIKIRFFIVLLILVILLMGCSSSKNEALSTSGPVTNKKIIGTYASTDLKFYKYNELGYEIVYPENYFIDLSGGHSQEANTEYETRLSLYSKDGKPGLDIDTINKVNYKDKYKNAEDYIKYKNLNIKIEEDVIINDMFNKIFKMEGDNYYFAFFENDRYIFQLSSGSKDFLKKIMMTFRNS